MNDDGRPMEHASSAQEVVEYQHFRNPVGQLMRVSREVLSRFEVNRQRNWWNAEAGGQLFGEIEKDLVTISLATGPRRSDIRGPFHFHPDRGAEQKEIDEQRELGLHFLGDWHTHFQNRPKPSRVDVLSMNDCVKLSKPRLGGLFLVIVGRAEFPNGLYVSFHMEDNIYVLRPVNMPATA